MFWPRRPTGNTAGSAIHAGSSGGLTLWYGVAGSPAVRPAARPVGDGDTGAAHPATKSVRTIARDRAAMIIRYLTHLNGVFRKSAHDTQDLVQETLFQKFKRIESFGVRNESLKG